MLHADKAGEPHLSKPAMKSGQVAKRNNTRFTRVVMAGAEHLSVLTGH